MIMNIGGACIMKPEWGDRESDDTRTQNKVRTVKGQTWGQEEDSKSISWLTEMLQTYISKNNFPQVR